MASRFWVGGTGTWDAADTTHWAATSGTAGGQSVPGSADTVTFDASSGGGTVTVNFGGLITIQSLTFGAFTGTLDFAANDNSITLTAAGGVSGTGTGTRTFNMGDGTWTLSSSTAAWNFGTTTNLTFAANASTISLSSGVSGRTFTGGGLTYNALILAGGTGSAVIFAGNNTFASIAVTGIIFIMLTAGSTQTITAAFTWTGTPSAGIGIASTTIGGQATISVAAGSPTIAWGALRWIVFAGGATFTATNTLDLGGNSGITITPPSASGGGVISG